jgi:hypothetical protein
MTTSSLMSLPIDIPWKRLGTSEDMMDAKAGDRQYPPRWRSSLAIFYHEPPEDEQQFEDRIVTYIKVCCTITGFQKHGKQAEIKVPPALLGRYRWAQAQLRLRNDIIQPYYPCYGAMLQVGVYPSAHVPLSSYPIFVDFQPKKREMYESATESNQLLSKSRSGINVKKGTTTTDYNETTVGAEVSGSYGSDAAYKVGGKAGFSHKWGEKTENVDMMTADYSREKRENYSYSTNLSHMYHLLNSYHMGTNRAMFVVQPRPHVVDSELTFVKGPRRLEGIQEFFLIVERPKDVAQICIEATLETAHLAVKPVYLPRVIPVTDLVKNNNHNKTAQAIGLKTPQEKGVLGQQLERLVHGWWVKADTVALHKGAEERNHPKGGSDVCLRRGWNNLGLDVRSKLIEEYKKGSYSTGFDSTWYFKPDYDSIDSKAKKRLDAWVREDYRHLCGVTDWVQGNNDTVGVSNAEVIYERVFQFTGDMFLTGRTTTNCQGAASVAQKPDGKRDSLVWEGKIGVPAASVPYGVSGGAERLSHLGSINQLIEDIGSKMIESLSASDRLPYGEVDIDESSLFLEPMRKAIAEMPDDDPYNVHLSAMDELEPELNERLQRVFGVSTRKAALLIEPHELRTRLDLSEVAVRRLTRQLIGSGPRLDERPEVVTIPDVVGQTLEAAREQLGAEGLRVADEVAYQDTMEPHDMVLDQYPDGGSQTSRGQVVQLVASSGPATVPEVVGLPVDHAAALLEESSLGFEVMHTASDEFAPEHVVQVTPPAHTDVPRRSTVVLLVARHRR